jgi:hypothetical protein
MITVQVAQYKARPYFKNNQRKKKKANGVTQVVRVPAQQDDTLSSNKTNKMG